MKKNINSTTNENNRKFTIIYNDFLESSLLNYYEKYLFTIMKKFADYKTLQCSPSLNTLTRVSGISKSQVEKCLKSMQKKGAIKIENRITKEKGNISNLYTLFDNKNVWNATAGNAETESTEKRTFTIIYNDFLESDLLNYYEKMLFIILKRFSNSKTLQCFPSLGTLSRVSGISKSHIHNCLKNMEKKGVINIEKRKNMSNLYTLYDSKEVWTAAASDTKELDEVVAKVEEKQLISTFETTEHKIINLNKAEDINEIISKVNDEILINLLKARGYEITSTVHQEENKEPKYSINEYNIREQEHKKKPESSSLTDDEDSSTQPNYRVNKIKLYNYDTTYKQKCQVFERYKIEEIFELCEYDILVDRHPIYTDEINAVFDILYDTVNTTKPTIRIAGEDKPKEVVISRLLKLGYETIKYAIDKYKEQCNRIYNPRAYMLTMLYKISEQFRFDITNQVKYDMCNFDWDEYRNRRTNDDSYDDL